MTKKLHCMWETVLMSKKIKEIDITAFRAYKDVQKFDFIHKNSGNIANLVAIYAPNGYGKTSFFDAVEWAVTGTIERLNNGKPIKEEVKNEEGYILKNRDSNEDHGNVTIISEQNKVFSVNTKKKRGKMKSDFKQGDVLKISPELDTIYAEKESFCTTNLLAHDKITGFLQNYTAKDKTSELQVMWDENNYSKILNDITELYNELEKKRKQFALELSSEEKELKKYKFENEKSDKVFELIENYKIKYDNDFMNDKYSDIEGMLFLFNQLHEESQKEREKKEKECNDIDILIKDYPVFEESQKKKCLLQESKVEFDKAIETWNKIEQIKKLQEEITREIEQTRYVLSNLKEFYSYMDQLNQNITELNMIGHNKIECQKEKISTADKIKELEEKWKHSNSELERLDTREEQLKKDYYEYNSNEAKKKKYERLSDKAKYILEQRNKRIQKLSLYIEQIDQFLAGKLGIEILCDIFTEEIIAEYNSITMFKIERKTLAENNNILESNKKNLVGLFNKIQQLSIKGRDIVIEQKQRECPLCHMEYQDYNELLDRISATTEENIELVKIDEQIQKNQKREWEIDKELKTLCGDTESQILSISNTYKAKYMEETKKVKRLETEAETWERNLNTAQYVYKTLEEKYKQEKLDISDSIQLENNEVKIEEERTRIKKDIDKVSDSMKEEKNKQKEFEQQFQAYELKILEIKEANNRINAEKIYIEIKKNLENKKFFDLKYNYLEMKSIIEASSKELEHRQDNLDNELTSYHLEDMCSKDEYLLKLNECYKEMNELQVEISSYLQRCEKLVGTTDKEQLFAQINQVKKNYYNKLESISEKIQSETSILIELNGLKEQTIWLNRKQSLELKKANLDYLDKRMEKLEESKNYVEDYIMNKTNEYFNSDIINQIYNKIDPHPMMKHIKFITEKDNDGLKTHIYTYDESETDKMSPVVYLSSAQVNILSLCIFLSKVLSEKNTTFNTIFIDDPIQHLDGINLLSFIDVLRTITTDFERQIVISTHNEQFYKLLKVKMDERYYPSKFIELTSTGKIKW